MLASYLGPCETATLSALSRSDRAAVADTLGMAATLIRRRLVQCECLVAHLENTAGSSISSSTKDARLWHKFDNCVPVELEVLQLGSMYVAARLNETMAEFRASVAAAISTSSRRKYRARSKQQVEAAAWSPDGPPQPCRADRIRIAYNSGIVACNSRADEMRTATVRHPFSDEETFDHEKEVFTVASIVRRRNAFVLPRGSTLLPGG